MKPLMDFVTKIQNSSDMNMHAWMWKHFLMLFESNRNRNMLLIHKGNDIITFYMIMTWPKIHKIEDTT
jgi:hypothetical protein